jgi:hypothetical protein
MERETIYDKDSPLLKQAMKEPLAFIPFNKKLYDEQQAFKNRNRLWNLYKKEQ